MTHAEFERWLAYYRLHPFDDYHRHHRPAAMVAASLGGAKVQDLLDWLEPEPIPEGYSAADVKTARAFGLKLPHRN